MGGAYETIEVTHCPAAFAPKIAAPESVMETEVAVSFIELFPSTRCAVEAQAAPVLV